MQDKGQVSDEILIDQKWVLNVAWGGQECCLLWQELSESCHEVPLQHIGVSDVVMGLLVLLGRKGSQSEVISDKGNKVPWCSIEL